MKPSLVSIILIVTVSATAILAQAQDGMLTPVQTYVRCHFMLTGERPSFREQSVKDIRSGKADPIQLCMQLLDDSVLAGDGYPNKRNTKTERVLQNMSRLHFTWFSERSDFKAVFRDDHNFYDTLEPALHWTRALLHPSAKVTDVLKRNVYLRGLKRRDPNWTAGTAPIIGYNSFRENRYPQANPNDNSVDVPWSGLRFADRGSLLGIVNMPATRINAHSFVRILNPTSAQRTRHHIELPGVSLRNMNIYRMLGGGVIGSPTYNVNTIRSTTSFRGFNGEVLPRLWAKAVYKDFLCKDLPAIRAADATEYVRTSSTFAFRRSASCTECHASIDPMSGNMRNLFRAVNQRFSGTNAQGIDRRRFGINTLYTANQPAAGWPTTVDNNYYRRPPNGRIKFRDYKGTLRTRNTSSLNDLGNAITGYDDFYICVAKRYYKHFMHVDVNLNDPETILEGNATDEFHKQRVINLGLELKKTGKTRDLIKTILQLEDFGRLDSGASQ